MVYKSKKFQNVAELVLIFLKFSSIFLVFPNIVIQEMWFMVCFN
jgi:hypothetical protein